MTRQDSSPDLIERYAVLAAIKTASRRLRRWPAASLDCCSARRTVILQAGTEKRHNNRTKKRTKEGSVCHAALLEEAQCHD
jgi:hypothetical protein